MSGSRGKRGSDVTGKRLERAFAKWMESQRFSFTKVRDGVRGKVIRQYEVDVYARRPHLGWRLTLLISFPLSLLFLVGGFYLYGRVTSLGGGVAVFLLLCLAMFGAAIAGVARKLTTQHVWVECRDRKAPVNRDDIHVLIGKVHDVRKHPAPHPEWVPTDVMFVSSSRFISSALELARAHFIECWLETPGGFIRAEEADRTASR